MINLKKNCERRHLRGGGGKPKKPTPAYATAVTLTGFSRLETFLVYNNISRYNQ